ncbi:hypothetical protein AKJ65_06450 [candidate division MSBL1 archaeon SCGC-AAA259E19]|uniref:N-(5'-phosphoribosyl)anthranilate isomerase n=2 Tax=candidate division MSBL1 TaxID=215777 RepID=A0A133V1Q6_9EURY|nr:hypothetical protein AKJ65_06450 [candidate division MSBL1 archaeon SCGC-AAA259E19]KXB00362.1 hypothetical protein AKJ41_04125 [candidate division MSBL1 archaeon SCGC-AAA259O05]
MVRVKLCGHTRPDDARLADELGADMIGIIVGVSVPTPREVSLVQARRILDSISGDVETVTVTMPESFEDGRDLALKLDVDYLQIHSSLPPSELRKLREGTEKKIIGVSKVTQGSSESQNQISRAKNIAQASDLLLLDTEVEAAGGTGEVHDWGISREIVREVDVPVILAGGLNPFNVGEAIREVEPYGVDVASGVEVEDGKKDPELVRKFIQNARG